MFEFKDIYWEVHPVFFVSRFLGMSPYTRRFKLSLICTTVTVLYILWTASNSTYIFILMHKLNSTFKLSPYSLILERVQTSIVTIVMIMSFCLSIANVRQLEGLMESFSRADRELRGVGVFVSPSRKFGLITIGIRLTIVFSILYKELRATAGTVTQLMIQYLIIAPMTMAFIPEAQFMVLVNAIHLRVSTMIADMKSDVVNHYSSKSKKLQAFIIVHSFLVESCSTINSLYQIQILFIVSSIFINNTANAYHVIEKTVHLILHFSEADALTLTITASRVILRTYEVWSVVATCFRTQETIKEFNCMLYQVMIEDESGTLAENKKLQLHVSMKKEVEFTAYNFFPIDYTLVHSMISAATTYLVILVQFSSLSATPETTTPAAAAPPTAIPTTVSPVFTNSLI
uniref:Gustatory receptor n=3 Tax=Lygus hesperus TaxID=30085 RepID=A0A146LU20_LYGHE